jgi:hypothetical protein
MMDGPGPESSILESFRPIGEDIAEAIEMGELDESRSNAKKQLSRLEPSLFDVTDELS